MINFSKLQLTEDAIARDAEVNAADKANTSGEKQINDTQRRKERQKAHMSTQQSTPMKSDTSYTAEDYDLRTLKELYKMRRSAQSDWRDELTEASKDKGITGTHPFVDVMPFTDQKAKETKKQLSAASKEGGKQAKQGSEVPMDEHFIQEETTEDVKGMSGPEFFAKLDTQRKKQKAKAKKEVKEEMSVQDQMKISREAAKKRNPNPDHRAIRGKMLKSRPPVDTRTQREKESQGRYR